jgi:hypothetical protein
MLAHDAYQRKPRVRDTVYFQPVEGGILFRDDDKTMVLNGKSAYSWFERLLPSLDGTKSYSEICNGLSEERRRMIDLIVLPLAEAGFIRWIEHEVESPATTLWQQHYRVQLEFIANYSSRPMEKFAKFHQCSTLIVAPQQAALRLAASGLENGLSRQTLVCHDVSVATVATRLAIRDLLKEFGTGDERIEVTTAPDPDASRDDWRGIIERHDAVILFPEVSQWGPVAELAGVCREAAKTLIVAMAIEYEGTFIASFPVGTEAPCWDCFRARLAGSEAELRLSRLTDQGPIAIAAVAGLAIFQLFAVRAELAEAAKNVVEVRHDTWEVFRRRLVQLPSCRLCSPGTQSVEELLRLAEMWPRQPADFSAEALLATLKDKLTDERVGVLLELSEGSLQQIPYHQSYARVSHVDEVSQRLIVESALEPFEARIRAAVCALEREISCASTHATSYLAYSFEDDSLTPGAPREDDTALYHVVASGMDYPGIIANGFWKSFGKWISQHSGWTPIQGDPTGVTRVTRSLLDMYQVQYDWRIEKTDYAGIAAARVWRDNSVVAIAVSSIEAGAVDAAVRMAWSEIADGKREVIEEAKSYHDISVADTRTHAVRIMKSASLQFLLAPAEYRPVSEATGLYFSHFYLARA